MITASASAPTPNIRRRLLPGARSAAAAALVLSVTATGCADLSGTATTGTPASASSSVQAAAMPASAPVRVDIPGLKISSRVISLGLNKDHTVAVPPIQKNDPVGWYKYSPTPGQTGPAVLLGHVTVGRYGKGVFYQLKNISKGDVISVERKDGRTAHFTVDRVKNYPKSQFPTNQVYANTSTPQLRVITCAGGLDPKTDSYRENLIVFASLAPS